jgi:pimeloyl-ACP methyl ester carboxylesterase
MTRDICAEPLPGAFQVVAGIPIWHVVAGAGPPMLFLHGIPTSSYLWRNVQRPLSASFRTIAPDLVGMGKSRPPPGADLALEQQAWWMLHLLDSLEIDRVVVVAHDVGGAVAHHLVRADRSRVRALVVMNVAAFADTWPVPVVKALRAPILGDLATALPTKRMLARDLGRGLHGGRPPTGAVLDAYFLPLASLRGRRTLLRFLRGMDAGSAERALRSYVDLDIPRLILWGEEDPYQPIAHGRRLHDLWRGSTFVPIAKASHFLQEDRPERVAAEIQAFLAVPP